MWCPRCQRPFPAGATACPRDGGALLPPVSELLGRPAPLSVAVTVAEVLLEALGPLHAIHKAHGAISPATVFVAFDAAGAEAALAMVGPAPPPAYLAPEVLAGHPTSPAADVYALGVLLFHLIGQTPPFAGQNATEIEASRRKHPQPKLGRLSLQDVPLELEQLIASMLAADPAARPKELAVLRGRLESLELDSTLTGQRLAALLKVEQTERASFTARPELAPEVDPFGDTLIRNRSSLVDPPLVSNNPGASMETVLDLGPKIRAPTGIGPDGEEVGDMDTRLNFQTPPEVKAKWAAVVRAPRPPSVPAEPVPPTHKLPVLLVVGALAFITALGVTLLLLS